MPKLVTNYTWVSAQIKSLCVKHSRVWHPAVHRQSAVRSLTERRRGSCLEGNPRTAKDRVSLIILRETTDTNLRRHRWYDGRAQISTVAKFILFLLVLHRYHFLAPDTDSDTQLYGIGRCRYRTDTTPFEKTKHKSVFLLIRTAYSLGCKIIAIMAWSGTA